MSEAPLSHEHQNRPQDPEQGLVVGGLSKLVHEWREVWLGPIETTGTPDRSSDEVNRITAQYSLATGPDMRIKFPGALKDISDAHKGEFRPVKRSERRTAKKIEKALIRNTRKAGVVHDLHTIYDLPDPNYEAPGTPDRRPGIGNSDVRASVEEALRRAGLLNDQPPQTSAPKLRIGTPEYRQGVVNLPHSRKRLKGIGKATTLTNKFDKQVSKNVDYVKGISKSADDPTTQDLDLQSTEITRKASDHLLNMEPADIKATLQKRVIARLLGDMRRQDEDSETQLKRVQKQILGEAVAGRTLDEKKRIIAAIEEAPARPASPEKKPGEVNELSELVEVVEARKEQSPEPKVTTMTRAEWAAQRKQAAQKQTGAIADPHTALKRSLNPPNYHG